VVKIIIPLIIFLSTLFLKLSPFYNYSLMPIVCVLENIALFITGHIFYKQKTIYATFAMILLITILIDMKLNEWTIKRQLTPIEQLSYLILLTSYLLGGIAHTGR